MILPTLGELVNLYKFLGSDPGDMHVVYATSVQCNVTLKSLDLLWHSAITCFVMHDLGQPRTAETCLLLFDVYY